MSVKKWLKVIVTLEGRISIMGRQYTSERKQYDGMECWLWLTPSEADWLIKQLYEAMSQK